MFAKRTFLTAVLMALVVFQFAPAANSIAAGASAAARCNWVGFVADMTVADGSIKQPGEAFLKTWRLKNIGSCAWTHDYELFYLKGDQMGAVKWTPMPGRISPGEQVDISVAMTAPTTPGRYRGYFVLRDEAQNQFGMGNVAGDPFWVDIVVSSAFVPGYDFAANACAATWRSGAGVLPCPGTDGNSNGFVVKADQPKLEDGSTDPLAGLIVGPQGKFNGYLQGFYPEIAVKSGDHFQAIVGCAFGAADCLVTFRLDYQISGGAIHTFWQWNEKDEGRTYRVDKDMSFLAGQNVRFILTLLAAGPHAGDRAIWGEPRYVRSGGGDVSAPTFTPVPATATRTATSSGPTAASPTTAGPTATGPTAVVPTATFTSAPQPQGTVIDFTSNICSAVWWSGAGQLPCPMADGAATGYAVVQNNPLLEDGTTDSLPGLVVGPQNKTDGYLQGFYPEYTVQPGDHFQTVVGCANGSSCLVTYRLDYRINGGAINILWKWKEANEGHVFNEDFDLSSLAGQRVSFILTLLATGSPVGDRAIWGHPRIVRAGFVPPSATPTSPPGSVTGVTVAANPIFTACGGPNVVDFSGTITTNGAANVTYHWEVGGDATAGTPDQQLAFSTAGTQAVNTDAFTANCGNYFVKLVVTAPNNISAQANFIIAAQTVTPGPSPTATRTPTPTKTATPAPTTPVPPASATPTSVPPPSGMTFDFTSNICSAAWWSGAGHLPCPMADGAATGYAVVVNNPLLENGTTDGLPGLIVGPQNKTDGYIQGFYPDYTVQAGDHFQTVVGCANGSSCFVTYRLDYRINGGAIHILWTWTEANDNQVFNEDFDLSSLAGQRVSFILTLLAKGSASGDRAIWGHPRIVRAGFVPPTATPPSTDGWPPYTNSAWGFRFNYPPDTLVSDQTENGVHMQFSILPGTNLGRKYLDAGAGPSSGTCSSGMQGGPGGTQSQVSFNGISFLKETGEDVGAGQTYDWTAYSSEHNGVCVGFMFILHSNNPGFFATPPPVFDMGAESAVFDQIMGTFTWIAASGTSTPTVTPPASPTPSSTPTPTAT